MPALAGELQHGGKVPDVPVIVLAAVGVDPGLRLLMGGGALREMTEGQRRMHPALAGSVTRGELRVFDDARHSTITTDRPEAVIQAVRDLAGLARG